MKNDYISDQHLLQTEQDDEFVKRNLMRSLGIERAGKADESAIEELDSYIASDTNIFRLYMAVRINDLTVRANHEGLPINIANSIKKEAFAALSRARRNSEISEIVVSVTEQIQAAQNKYRSSCYSYPVQRAVEYIHIQRFKPLSASDVADHLNMDRSYLSKRFHAETGQTITDYIHLVKLNVAIELIYSHEYTMVEIADLLGYSSYHYFARVFKKYKGFLPKELVMQKGYSDIIEKSTKQ